MPDRTLIIHGWSDCSDSFKDLKRCLVANGIGDVSTIYYADYESREDNVTFEDVVGGLNDVLFEKGLIDAKGHGSFNVVVHSTGGLVIRHWIWRYYRDRPDECPVENLVMLAPANFGSPLAHRGKSFLGQLVKGRWKIGDFLEVGEQLLNGLELASPYQWQLAHRDLLGPDTFYDEGRVRLTVLVGLDDYAGLRGWVNKPGTDGTVVVAGTPLNAIKVTLDFLDESGPKSWTTPTRIGRFAFGALTGFDHGSIVSGFADHRDDPPPTVVGHVLSALRVRTAKQFDKHCKAVQAETAAAYGDGGSSGTTLPQYQQFFFHAVDDQGESIRDFSTEFFVREARRADDANAVITTSRSTKEERALSEKVNKLMTAEFHTYRSDGSYRRILVDTSAVAPLVPPGHLLAMSMHVPDVDRGIRYDTENTRDVVLWDPENEQGPRFFFPNTTTLVELVVDRITDYVWLGKNPSKH